MKNEIYFSNEEFKQIAMNQGPITETSLTPTDAFFLLIADVNLKDLNLYCENIQKTYYPNLSIEEIYTFIQQPESLSQEQKDAFFEIALTTEQFGSNLVNPMPNLFINTSSWISHTLNVGICARNLANGLENVDPNTTFVLGILHDIGRKFKTDMQHTVYGYEYLVSKGYPNEAKICLTHSHILGERCANNEPAVPGWSCINGVSTWDPSIETDDLTKFLQNTSYNVYDSVLNIADLMATEKDILPVHERLKDIAKRRKIDPTNRPFFFASLINLLNEYLHASIIDEDYTPISATDDVSLDSLEQTLINTSNAFFAHYKTLEPTENTPKKKITN